MNLAKVALLVENGFEDVELFYPYYRYQEAGYQVEVIGPQAGVVYEGKKGGSSNSRSPQRISIWMSTSL